VKKILFVVLFFAVVVTAIVLFYRSFESSDPALSDALRAVPANAALIVETGDAADIWRDLSQTNLIWEELRATDLYFRLDQAGHALDSAMRNQSELRSYLSEKPVAISVHMAGSRSYSYLLSVQLEADVTEAEVREAVVSLFKPREALSQKTYDGVNLYQLKPAYLDQEIHFFITEGLLVLSFSTLLAEESIRALRQNASIIADPAFAAVRKTTGKDARGQLYINYKQLKNILVQYAGDQHKGHIFFKQPYAGWSALDMELRSNAMVFNGFVQARDSSDAWLGAFSNITAPSMEVLGYMPTNTAYFAFFGYGDFKQFKVQELAISERAGRQFARDTKRKEYDAKCNCDSQSLTTSWIGNQAATFITEPSGAEYTQSQFAVFMASDVTAAWEGLLELDASMRAAANQKPETERYRDIDIQKLHIGAIYGDLLGEAYGALQDPYAFAYDDVVVMGNSLNGMRSLINAIIAGRTLENDKGFAQLGNQISGSSNFLVYSALARSPFIFQHLLTDTHAAEIAEQTTVLRNFQAFVYQVSHYRDDLYYNNIYFRHNPDYKQETNSLWEAPLQASVSKRPFLLTNHYTNALEIILQDDSNRVYLMSNTGKALWDVPLDGPVVGDVSQVDIYRNGKLQILLSTPTSIYLLDRNGSNVESYPVRLSAKATTPVTAIDYDGNRDYRFFIGLEGGSIMAYDIAGKRVDGWEFSGHPADIISPVSHLRVKSRDYVFALSSAGDVLLLDRRGKPRHRVNQRAVGLADGGYQVELGSNTIDQGALYYVDTLGAAQRLGFDGRAKQLDVPVQRPVAYDFKDVDGDGKTDCIILTEKALEAYTQEGKKIFSTSTGGVKFTSLQYFRFPDGKVCFGLTAPGDSQVVLYGSDGSVQKGFPLYGAVPFAIGDMNRDGYFNLVTASREGYVYAYALER
jgi:hypothetical protein